MLNKTNKKKNKHLRQRAGKNKQVHQNKTKQTPPATGQDGSKVTDHKPKEHLRLRGRLNKNKLTKTKSACGNGAGSNKQV